MSENRFRRAFRAWALATLMLLQTQAPRAQEFAAAQPEEAGVSAEKAQELSRFMQSLVDQGSIAGGVTLLARHGKVVHLEAVGMADRESQKAMEPNAIFRIASMTKPITSVAVMMLRDQGKLDLDDPVSKYIPAFANPRVMESVDPLETVPARSEITIRQLLTHTSGLGYTFTPTLGPLYDQRSLHGGLSTMETTLQPFMDELAKAPLLFQPGERFEYSMATDVLGRVVEVAAEVPFEHFVLGNICRPLGMKDTFFQVPEEKRSRLVATYIPVGTCLRQVKPGEILKHDLGAGRVTISSDYPYDPRHQFRSGGVGLCSTAADYLRFCQMLLDGGTLGDVQLLRAETVKEMTTIHTGDSEILWLPGGFGYGFHILPDSEDTHEQLSDSYAWFGFWSTSFRISPRGNWIVISMAQVAWNDTTTPNWFAEYERLAADAITD